MTFQIPVERSIHWTMGAQKILFLSISTWERFFIIYTLSKSPNESIYHLFAFIISTCWALQNGRTRHTYKNLVYNLAHHESPIAQWLERPTGIWKVMGSTPIGGSEMYFDLRTLLHYLHFIQVTNPFIFFFSLKEFSGIFSSNAMAFIIMSTIIWQQSTVSS